MTEWTRKQASAIADIQQRLADLDEKLDKILIACCSHRRTVAAHEEGAPVVCEDCGVIVGRVPLR